MNAFCKRQNDREAIMLYKASTYCYKREYRLRYTIIIFSLLFCFIGIFLNCYLKLNKLDANTEQYQQMSKQVSLLLEINSIASGLYLIVQIFLNMHCIKMHKEAVHLEEMYDNYVYNIAPNNFLLKPITEIAVNSYARKLRRSNSHFMNKYFTEKNVQTNMVFKNQKHIIQETYDVLNYSKEKWFMPAWIFVIILIFVFALVVNEDFMMTLRAIFFPSLTAIVIIVNSHHNHSQNTAVIHNCYNSVNKVTKFKDPLIIRDLQDAIFNCRMSSFTMPQFVHRRFKKFERKQEIKLEKIRIKEENSRVKKIKAVPAKIESDYEVITPKPARKTLITKENKKSLVDTEKIPVAKNKETKVKNSLKA